jgi:starch phosphorylase
VIDLYLRLRDDPGAEILPRTVLFGGKAAPDYTMAKRIIRLINDVAKVVNADERMKGRLNVLFLPDYRVSLAERIIPAADLSEQISTAGREASGTGNMKFALNGALTIGTLDGANIEICDAVGKENMFLFGLTSDEVTDAREGYDPRALVEGNPRLKRILDLIGGGFFRPDEPGCYTPLLDSILGNDEYMVLKDFDSYLEAQELAERIYRDPDTWTRMSIRNVAAMGRFSSDRTVSEYAKEIWEVSPTPIRIP